MSLIPIGTTLIVAAAQNLIAPVFFRARRFGSFIAYLTIEENHADELAITDHPVERGAAISDHAYKRPAQVTIRAGWSNSSPLAFLNPLGQSPNYVQQIYDAVLVLQSSLTPFDIITGKRKYTSMMLMRIHETTNENTENALILTMEFKQVIITSTQTVTVPDASKMKTPPATAAIQNTGKVALGPGTNFNADAVA